MEDFIKELIDLLKLSSKIEVVDIGASNLGETAPYQRLVDMGIANVVGFEPSEESWKNLVANAKKNETYLPYAVGDGSTKPLYITAAAGLTSLFKLNIPVLKHLLTLLKGSKVTGVVELPTKKLDDIDEIKRIDLLKIDIQVGEVDVF